MNKKIIFLILLLAILLLPVTSFGAVNSVKDLITNAKTSLTGIGGALATIAFIVAGIMFLTATGNPSNMETGKKALIAAIIGIVIILLSATAETFVKTFFSI